MATKVSSRTHRRNGTDECVKMAEQVDYDTFIDAWRRIHRTGSYLRWPAPHSQRKDGSAARNEARREDARKVMRGTSAGLQDLIEDLN